MGVARAHIDFENLLAVFVSDCSISLEAWQGIPSDAKILNGGYSEEKRAWYVDFEHPDFKDFDEIDVILQGYFMDVVGNNHINKGEK